MGSRSPRWRRFGVATAVVLTTVAGTAACSSDGRSTPTAVQDPAGTAALARAVSATAALHSYAFQASQRITGGRAPQATQVNGRAVRPASLAYTVTVGSKAEQVVKIGPAVYVRIAPAPWKKLTTPTPVVDPVASLTALLAASRSPRLSGTTLTAEVPAAALSAAQLAPTGAAPGAAAPVSMVLDPSGRVVSVTLTLTAKAGSNRLTVVESTAFSSFDAVAPIAKP